MKTDYRMPEGQHMTLLELKQLYGLDDHKGSTRDVLNTILRRTPWASEILDLTTLTNQIMHRYPPGSEDRERYRHLHERLANVCDELREGLLRKHGVGGR